MSWTYQNTVVVEPPELAIGYVYCITNISTNRKYIGKKFFKFSKTSYKMVKLKNGTKKRKRIKSQIPSDWQEYWGSSAELSNDVELLGFENFTREILHYCYSKAECTYLELKEQILRSVLESDEYYNGQIHARCHKSHIKNKLLK